MQPLISVIVPIYKVEPYLRRCLDSIVNQTYTNLEIILVDDGSPDGCPAICDEYAAKNNRIVVIHKKNGGLSDARNAGLDICKGEYITFVDSDDWLADCFIEKLYEAITLQDSDIAICSYTKTTSTFSSSIKNTVITPIHYSPIDAIKKLWSNEATTFVTSCWKLYKKDLFKEVRFPKGVINEDERTTHKIYYASKKIVFIDIPLYFYFQRIDSITAQQPFVTARTIKTQEERFLFFKVHKEIEIEKLCLKNFCWDIIHIYCKYNDFSRILQNDYNSPKDLLKLFRFSVQEYTRLKVGSTFNLLFLNVVAKFPLIYMVYKKIS